MNLNEVKINIPCTIIALSGECENLRDWGFCENLEVIKIQCGKNIICKLCGAKVALCDKLAQKIIVQKKHLELI